MNSIFSPVNKPVYKVDYSNLQDFIASEYEISSFTIGELCNDSEMVFEVSLTYFDEEDAAKARSLIAAGYAPEWQMQSIMNLMFLDKKIVEADYIVDVCW